MGPLTPYIERVALSHTAASQNTNPPNNMGMQYVHHTEAGNVYAYLHSKEGDSICPQGATEFNVPELCIQVIQPKQLAMLLRG